MALIFPAGTCSLPPPPEGSAFELDIEVCSMVSDYIPLIGPWCAGVLLSYIGLAFLLSQTILYHRTFNREKLYIKLLVYGTTLLEVTQTVVLTLWMWNFLIPNTLVLVMQYVIPSSNALSTRGDMWMWIAIFALSGIVPFPIQVFYAFHIVSVSKRQWPAYVITFVSIISLAMSIAVTVFSRALVLTRALTVGQSPHDEVVSHAKLWQVLVVGIWGGVGAICNILIVGCMWHALVKHSSTEDRSWKTLSQLIKAIVSLTIKTGLFAAIGYLVLLYLLYQESISTFMAAWIVLPKLYSNMLLLMLNSRIKFEVISDSSTWNNNHSTAPLSDLHFRHLTRLAEDDR